MRLSASPSPEPCSPRTEKPPKARTTSAEDIDELTDLTTLGMRSEFFNAILLNLPERFFETGAGESRTYAPGYQCNRLSTFPEPAL
jgi:hypothetical protein